MTDRVIEIRLNAPRPNLLQLLAQPEFGWSSASVGTGPFDRPPHGRRLRRAACGLEEAADPLLTRIEFRMPRTR